MTSLVQLLQHAAFRGQNIVTALSQLAARNQREDLQCLERWNCVSWVRHLAPKRSGSICPAGSPARSVLLSGVIPVILKNDLLPRGGVPPYAPSTQALNG